MSGVFVAMLQFIALSGFGQFVHDAIDPEFRFGSLKYNPEFQPYFELHPILPDSGQVVTVTEEDELVLDTIFRIHRKSKELFLFERSGREIYKYYRMSLPIDSCFQLFKNNYDYYTVVGSDGYLIADEFRVKQMKFDTSGICCSYDIIYKSDARSGKSRFHKDSIQIFDNNLLVYTIHHDNFGNIDSIIDNYYKAEFSKVVFLRHPFYNTLTIEEYSLSRKSKTDVFDNAEAFAYDSQGRISYLVLNHGIHEGHWCEVYNYLYLDNGNVNCLRNYPGLTRILHYTVESSGD
jgi:hypothetical protein